MGSCPDTDIDPTFLSIHNESLSHLKHSTANSAVICINAVESNDFPT